MDAELSALVQDSEVREVLKRDYLRFDQRQEHEREIARIDAQLTDPAERKKLLNPGKLKAQNDERKTNLRRQSPPALTGSQRDKIARIEKLALASAVEGMPSQEEMRHNPPGTVDTLRDWQAAKKPTVLLWKRCRVVLNPDSDHRDLANLERFRPARPTRSLFTDGDLNRPFALSAEAKANYDAINWADPEFQAELQRQVDAGTVKINLGVRRGNLRAPKSTAGADCPHCQRPFYGKAAKAQRARHEPHCPERKDLVGGPA